MPEDCLMVQPWVDALVHGAVDSTVTGPSNAAGDATTSKKSNIGTKCENQMNEFICKL